MNFKSKRNAVSRDGNTVVKICGSAEAAETEAEILKRLLAAGVSVPAVLDVSGKALKTAYIAGETVPDFLERMESNPDKAELETAAAALADWFCCFYRAVRTESESIIRGDVNGRNFIWNGGSFIGVDFETYANGSMEQDAGRLSAFITSYNPSNTAVKNLFSNAFLAALNAKIPLAAEVTENFRAAELADMKKRRE